MGDNRIIKHENGQLQKVGNAITITNKLLALTEPELIPFKNKDMLWGFCTSEKQMVINCIYWEVDLFYKGLSRVSKMSTGKYGIIDRTGGEVIPCIYDDVNYYQNGLASVQLNGKWGFVDKYGKEVIQCIYNSEGIMGEVAPVFCEERAWIECEGKWGFIDKAGTQIVPYIYEIFDDSGNYSFRFSHGLKAVRIDNKWGFVNTSGDIQIPLIYDDAHDFCEGMAAVEIDGRLEYLDILGNVRIYLPDYRLENFWSNRFKNGLAQVSKFGEYGIIDKSGKLIIPCIYDMIMPDLSTRGDFSNEMILASIGGKVGFLNKLGEQRIPFIYENANNFSEGYANVRSSGKWGYIDEAGNVVISFIYDDADVFSEGLAAVKFEGKWGFINKIGKIISPLNYEETSRFSDGLASVKVNNKYGFINKEGVLIIPCFYDSVFSFSNGLARVARDDEEHQISTQEYGYIDKKGFEYWDLIEYSHDWMFRYDPDFYFAKGSDRMKIMDFRGAITNYNIVIYFYDNYIIEEKDFSFYSSAFYLRGLAKKAIKDTDGVIRDLSISAKLGNKQAATDLANL